MKKILLLFISLFLVINLSAQNDGFLKTKNGLKYKLIEHDENAKKAQMGNFITFHFEMKNSKGEVMISSFKKNKPAQNIKITQAKNNADVGEIFTYTAEGDSLILLLPADSLAKYIKRYPPKVDTGSVIYYTLKILKIKDKEEVKVEQAEITKAKEKKELERIKKIKGFRGPIEFPEIEAYAKENNLSLQQTESGLYYIITKKGTGQKARKGQKIKVTYTGKLLDGKVFDSCIEDVAKANDLYNPQRTYGSFSFKLGGRVIKGWNEGFSLLNVGDKATLVIPSYLGYGTKGSGNRIPPNSILVFDVEFLGIE